MTHYTYVFPAKNRPRLSISSAGILKIPELHTYESAAGYISKPPAKSGTFRKCALIL
jgi:hypothetical protein